MKSVVRELCRCAVTGTAVIIAVMLFILSFKATKANSYGISMPVSDGVLEQNITEQAELPSAVQKRVYIGVFKLTAYCPCYNCSEGWGNMTSTGVRAKSDHTVAVDPAVIPYGSIITIGDSCVEYRAEDCGGAINGNELDIFFDTHNEVEAFGVCYMPIYLLADEQ